MADKTPRRWLRVLGYVGFFLACFVVSLYLTSFVIEKLINHKAVVDIYGSDTDIYICINEQVEKVLS